MKFKFGSFNEYGEIKLVAVRKPSDAFRNDAKLDAEWKDLNYHTRPDLENAKTEFSAFEKYLSSAGAEIKRLGADKELTLDALYVRDSVVVTPRGLVLPRMGKEQRRAESGINCAALKEMDIPIAGAIEGEGKLEGGDLVWLDRFTLLAGVGYRTNLEGVRQLRMLAGEDVDVVSFDLPHFKGPSDVFHLMSVLSPVDRDLAVVYKPMMPARLVEFLRARGIEMIDVPDAEFPTMGCNVLALAPRKALLVEGNRETERRLVAAGCEVVTFKGKDICRKGEGGPTCLTRPLVRK